MSSLSALKKFITFEFALSSQPAFVFAIPKRKTLGFSQIFQSISPLKQSKHHQHRSAKIDIQGNSKMEIQECNYSLNLACKTRRRQTALCEVVDDRRTTAFASCACALAYISLPVVVERDVVVVLKLPNVSLLFC